MAGLAAKSRACFGMRPLCEENQHQLGGVRIEYSSLNNFKNLPVANLRENQPTAVPAASAGWILNH